MYQETEKELKAYKSAIQSCIGIDPDSNTETKGGLNANKASLASIV